MLVTTTILDYTQVQDIAIHLISSNAGLFQAASRDSMSVIRQIFWICAKYNIYLAACHIAGEVNLVADWLSRTCIRGYLGIDSLPLCCRGHGAAR